jgi:hypothetical protein
MTGYLGGLHSLLTAAMTPCITALPSTPLPVPGVGRAHWRVELIRYAIPGLVSGSLLAPAKTPD